MLQHDALIKIGPDLSHGNPIGFFFFFFLSVHQIGKIIGWLLDDEIQPNGSSPFLAVGSFQDSS